MMKQLNINICEPCGQSFENENQYLKHECPTTGFVPSSVEHLDITSEGRFSKQSQEALKRGELRKIKII